MQKSFQMYTYWRDIYMKMHHDHYKQLSLQNKQQRQAALLQKSKKRTPDVPKVKTEAADTDDDITVVKLERFD